MKHINTGVNSDIHIAFYGLKKAQMGICFVKSAIKKAVPMWSRKPPLVTFYIKNFKYKQ